jgi:predicted RNA-binding protein
MCESNVYMIGKDGNEQLVMESVDLIEPGEDTVTMENIFSQRLTVKARIKQMHLVDHRILLEEK